MKIYLASPFFDNEERARVKLVKHILRSKGFEVFVPMEHKVENAEAISNFEWGSAVFKMDKNAIHSCDVMVVLYDGLYSDTGTAWECGYAFANNIPVVMVCPQIYMGRSSLMMVNGCYSCLHSLSELELYDFNKMEVRNYQGEQK